MNQKLKEIFKGKVVKEVDPRKTSKEEILSYIMGDKKVE